MGRRAIPGGPLRSPTARIKNAPPEPGRGFCVYSRALQTGRDGRAARNRRGDLIAGQRPSGCSQNGNRLAGWRVSAGAASAEPCVQDAPDQERGDHGNDQSCGAETVHEANIAARLRERQLSFGGGGPNLSSQGLGLRAHFWLRLPRGFIKNASPLPPG